MVLLIVENALELQQFPSQNRHWGVGWPNCLDKQFCQHLGLRGPVAILFISRDTCSDSIAMFFSCLFFWGIAQLSRDTCKMGYRTDVPV